jgi:hypothetical protein
MNEVKSKNPVGNRLRHSENDQHRPRKVAKADKQTYNYSRFVLIDASSHLS